MRAGENKREHAHMYPRPHTSNTLCGNSTNMGPDLLPCVPTAKTQAVSLTSKYVEEVKSGSRLESCPTWGQASRRASWIVELEFLGICRVTEVVWFLCKRDFLATFGLAGETKWAGTGVSFEECEGDDNSVGDDDNDILEMDRKGFAELERCGITAHDFAARNICAFNVEFLTRCDDSEETGPG